MLRKSLLVMSLLLLVIVAALSLGYFWADNQIVTVENFLDDYNKRFGLLTNEKVIADWKFRTNITDYNEKISLEVGRKLDEYSAEAYKKSKHYLDLYEKQNKTLSFDVRRQLKKVGEASLPSEEMSKLSTISSDIASKYSNGAVCLFLEDGKKCMQLQPGLKNLMRKPGNYTQLRQIWKKWRDEVGKKIRPQIPDWITLKNKRAVLNGYADYGDEMRSRYEVDDFEERIRRLNDQLSPLYKLIHAYVRKKLREIYDEKEIPQRGLIPACVLGDMWGRFWTDIFEVVAPYPNVTSVDPTERMKEMNITVKQMYEMADQFYTSMGLKPLPITFYERSLLLKPDDGRNIDCHATAWDFFDGKDFRIKMCTEVNFEDLEVVHHELGHIQYFMQYAHLPVVYRDGANDGFHEAVGELMGITMSTVSHLKARNLLPASDENAFENSINFLLRTALKSVINIPFHFVNDLWRWKVFRGEVPESEWNSYYWKLKNKYLGVRAPVERTEEHLDIFSIFHVVNDFDMVRYFTRTVLQFQFAESLCDAAEYEGPLHDCDFSGSKAAGDKLAAMLSLGSSKHWQDALEQITGTREMDVSSLIKFFSPLQEWLQEYLEREDEAIGWAGEDEAIS